ncbi:MAG: putative transport system permease protein, partial [Gemmatimonadaceae bacterium]|nr:putative transport system permease protein [Gemmatimonadaceae bacterium]
MTRRALGDVPVDWQIEIVPGANTDSVAQEVHQAARVTTVDTVGYADVNSFTARLGGNTLGGTTQTTGEGNVLGVTPTYWKDFPAQLRPMLGASEGILIAQQTAANLNVTVGDTISIARIGLPTVTARVDGVVDLPQADALFQAVGVPPGAAPQAPPDNV